VLWRETGLLSRPLGKTLISLGRQIDQIDQTNQIDLIVTLRSACVFRRLRNARPNGAASLSNA